MVAAMSMKNWSVNEPLPTTGESDLCRLLGPSRSVDDDRLLSPTSEGDSVVAVAESAIWVYTLVVRRPLVFAHPWKVMTYCLCLGVGTPRDMR